MSNAFSVEVREKSGLFQTCEGWGTWNDGCTDMGADCGSNGAKTRRVPIYCFIVAEGFTPPAPMQHASVGLCRST